MVAHLLHTCGLDLGQKRDLMPATPDNPRGYWENMKFVKINKEVLLRVGGEWDYPPTVPAAEWPAMPALAPIRRRARKLIESFRSSAHWGWKDPRNSFTLPFWRDLIPDLKVIICLRHPLEVYQSLKQRQYSPHPLGLILWRVYNQYLQAHASPGQRLITHYESYFTNATREAARVLRFLGMEKDVSSVAACSSVVTEHLRHHNHASPRMAGPGLPPDISEMYREMCKEAGTL
jgi:hypothetical protein